MLIHLHDATFGYQDRPVIHIDELSLSPGQSLGIFGPNGSGKTTLIRGISQLLKPLSGDVVHQLNLRIGYLPQLRNIDPHWPMSSLDAALMATSARTRFGWIARHKASALSIMKRLGVDHLAPQRFSTLSGGQQQRILLAGAMAPNPHVLLLDEPTDGLDIQSRQSFLDLLRQIATAGLATVIVSHDLEDLLAVCDSIARIRPADDPQHPTTVHLMSPTQLAQEVTAVTGMHR
jgi:ABC-type Mn2+/Zn2+ transport system ATPase subunit